ncbi:uncharacterized protein LOC132612751 [Lycium barbarum]|uniref:uncharacterized protein LOC132612751 n=1 Tax=Lycium barbarum TaxID=112863 RepID=UPI00293F27FC|nr:uncharacterized protein LOC132612751 [Lycium barbarum]
MGMAVSVGGQGEVEKTEGTREDGADILAIVVRCLPPRFVAIVQKRLQELILIDTDKQALTFKLWEETIIEDEGRKLLDQFQKCPIIFARRIGVSKYNGTSLTTKFNTTIQIDPPYSQCLQLHTWVTENREMLASFSLRSTSKSESLISVSVDEQTVPIANVQSQQDGHSFSIEAKVSLPNKLKSCYVLLCPNCKQEVRSLIKRNFLCMTCKQRNMLIRSYFYL